MASERDDAGLPFVFAIRGFSLDDGPGIRTTVFLKGCPLSCAWCHNPESWSRERELAFHAARCVMCGECVSACPEKALHFDRPERIDRERCTACGACEDGCPSRALEVVGRRYGPDELVERILENRVYYENSGGGVTFSGGEPTLHMDYLFPVLKRLKREQAHVALQTSGLFDPGEFREKMLPFLDLIYYDLKIMNSEQHEIYTGAGNERILENFRALAKEKVHLVPRTPLVPGVTALRENISSIARFIGAAGCGRYELLPYNPGGAGKRRAIGKNGGTMLPRTMMSREEERKWELFGKSVLAGSRNKKGAGL
jgi:pyruvate formate lyase activating enzyme